MLLLLLLLLLLLVTKQHVPDVVRRRGRVSTGHHDALPDAVVGDVFDACHALLEGGGWVLLHRVLLLLLLLLLLLRWYAIHLDVGGAHGMTALTTDARARVGVAWKDTCSTPLTATGHLLLL